MKVKIVAIGKGDAKHYKQKDFIGRIGIFDSEKVKSGGFRSGSFYPDEPIYSGEWHYFYRVKVHQIK